MHGKFETDAPEGEMKMKWKINLLKLVNLKLLLRLYTSENKYRKCVQTF